MGEPTFDQRVRLHVYRGVAARHAPSVEETAAALSALAEDVAASYRRLAEARALVLEPGTLTVRMANPFSAVPTDFRVETATGWHWGNCAWDALGIPAALHGDARITTHCGDCAEPLEVQVERGRPHGEAIEHLGVPARDFWKNIVFT